MSRKKTVKMSYEESVARLTEIISIIENPETALDESLDCYKEGMNLFVGCVNTLNDFEQQVSVISQRANEVLEQNFLQTEGNTGE